MLEGSWQSTPQHSRGCSDLFLAAGSVAVAVVLLLLLLLLPLMLSLLPRAL